VAGIADGCVEAGCTLIGGETAEMPGIYQAGQYDLAGFCVGAVERDQILTPDMVKQGDVAIALPSSGIHANGFSLIRNLIRREGLDYNSPSPFDRTMSLAMSILAPTRIYRDAVEAALLSGGVTGFSHITGGGLIENPPRCYAEDLCLRLSVKHRPLLPVFQWVKFSGNMTDAEFARTFNCGIGGIVFVKEDKADSVLRTIQETGEDAWLAGQIEKRTNDAVILEGMENSWR
jgi:phosphoribosylformylglycinamidine cyclo-ligase